MMESGKIKGKELSPGQYAEEKGRDIQDPDFREPNLGKRIRDEDLFDRQS